MNLYISQTGNDKNSGSINAPLATIGQGVKMAETLDENVNIYLKGGYHHILDKIVLNNCNNISFLSYDNEKTVISGGRKIENWTKNENNIWKTYIKDVKNGSYWFRNLFCNENRFIRARYPKNGYLVLDVVGANGDDRFYQIENAPQFANIENSQMELVIIHLWSESRGIVKSIKDNIVEVGYPLGWKGHPATTPAEGRKVYFEHSIDFLTEENEFYLDKQTGILSLKLKEGQNPNTMEIFAPEIETLIEIKNANNITFNNIGFMHTNWQLPNKGFSELQSGHYGTVYAKEPTYALPLAISLVKVGNIRFENCELAHFGAGGIGFGAKAINSCVDKCNFYDISGNGVMVGYRDQCDPVTNWFNKDWLDPTDSPDGNSICNSTFERCAQEQFSCVAIWEAFSNHTLISHNRIQDLPYIGISIGFSWEHEPTTQKNCIVEYNEIFNVMKIMFDGAGIYTLGEQKGSIVRNNYIHDVVNGHGIYTDEASRYILFENNIVFKVGNTAYQHHFGCENILRNNIFACARALYIRRFREDPEESFFMDRNIFFSDGGTFIDGTFQNGKFRFENNIYWCVKAAPFQYLNITHGQIGDWKDLGHDKNGRFIDPCFVDPLNGNFEFQSDSPVVKMGFNPIDMKQFGPK